MVRRQDRAIWLDYLRGFVTVLVVAHHSSLAYTTFASFNPQAYNASTHPIVDTARAYGLDLFEDFNDVFFMSLMFLISGIFVLPALARKGPRTFTRDRFYRLFIPCLIAVTFIMPLGYLASWHEAHGNYDLHAFLVDYIRVEHWPAGPPWFIGILFIFNLLIALCYNRFRPVFERWAASLAALSGRPFAIFWRGYALTLILFVPFIILFGSSRWIGFGPFAFQLCRILLYLGYFVLGMVIGAAGTDNGLLADNSGLMRYPLLWAILCILAYTALKLAGIHIQHWEDEGHHLTETEARLLYRPLWSLSCVASCMAFLAVFHRMVRSARRTWESLSVNAYGIYLVHYIFVLWLQYLMLPLDLPAVAKFALTFAGSLALSWMITAGARRIPVVRKYL